jgi:glycosyltransferase involved in cell wall biosynthesis
VLVGEGEDRVALEKLAAGDARIIMPGYHPNVAEWLGVFDAFISSSRYEGLALVGLEALHAGLPMLVTNVAGNAELAELCGLPTLDNTHPASWPSALQALVAQGRTRVSYNLEPFDKTAALEKIEAFYRHVGA